MTLNKYDDLAGPELDPDLWAPLNHGGPRLEPGAVTTVADGVVTVDIPEFTNAHEQSQGHDNAKHVLLSTRRFDLPKDRRARFQVELAVEHVGGSSGDYRLGVAAFILVDTEGSTGLVFDIQATADRVYAEHEALAIPSVQNPFTWMIESPFVATKDEGYRTCVVEIDRSVGRVTWTVDGQTLHEASGIEGLPESVHMGFGYFTLIPVAAGKGSVHGQGGRASWRGFMFDLDAADASVR